MHDDVIICADVIKDVFELTKVPAENNILQHLDKLACCYKELLVLMTVIIVCVTSQPQNNYY